MKKKVLVVYNQIQHYRRDFFEELGRCYDLTVLHSGEKYNNAITYEQIVAQCYRIGPFRWQRHVVRQIVSNKYDAVIFLFDVAWVSTLFGALLSKLFCRTLLWGAWYTKSEAANIVRTFYSKIADGNIFYSPGALLDFQSNGVGESKVYVANNTFKVVRKNPIPECGERWRILFIGSMDERKQNTILLNSFAAILSRIPNDIVLTFVGDGREFDTLVDQARSLDVSKRVEFLGRIEDVAMLEDIYDQTIVSISYGQAGLSVLQALGFGVPFMTKEGAISGGEIENVVHEYTGIICKTVDDLECSMIRLSNDREFASRLGVQAYDYYQKYCTIENMVSGFIDAVESTKTAMVDFK